MQKIEGNISEDRWNIQSVTDKCMPNSREALHALAQEVGLIGTAALEASFARFTNLGDDGLANVQKNQHGEMALRMDLEAEAEVIRVLREAKLPVRVYSEEHGVVDLADKPMFTATLDGIDGTKEYKDNRLEGRYGTLLSIYLGDSPCYDDYLFSGMMVHAEQRLYKVCKGSQAVIEYQTNQSGPPQTTPIILSNHVTLTEGRLFVDEYWEVNRSFFSAPLVQFKPQSTMSSTRYYSALAAGTADIVGECTRKGNLEIAAAYPIITAAGGFFVTIDGKSLGTQKFLEFGQGKNEYIPVLAAANISVLRNTLKILREYGIVGAQEP